MRLRTVKRKERRIASSDMNHYESDSVKRGEKREGGKETPNPPTPPPPPPKKGTSRSQLGNFHVGGGASYLFLTEGRKKGKSDFR